VRFPQGADNFKREVSGENLPKPHQASAGQLQIARLYRPRKLKVISNTKRLAAIRRFL